MASIFTGRDEYDGRGGKISTSMRGC